MGVVQIDIKLCFDYCVTLIINWVKIKVVMKRLWLIVFILAFMTGDVNLFGQNVVSTSGRQILLNGEPYLIRGVCYNPVPKGSTTISWSTLTEDLQLMTEAGINTIRTYSPIDNEAVLDEIAAAGVKIIMGFGYNQGGTFDILSGTFIDYIETYKNHDAILFWEFGNEYNYHPEWFSNNINIWYNALNNAAIDAQIEDPNHPVATAHGELPDNTALSLCPDIEIWGMNVYRWDNPSTIFSEWESTSNLPMYLSEAGADRYMTSSQNGYTQGENEQMQADATENILDAIFDNLDICAGVAIFAFNDEWWKAGSPSTHDIGGSAPNSSGVPYDGAPNEEYWGIVDIDRNKMQAYEVVKTKYLEYTTSSKSTTHHKIKVYPNPAKNLVKVDFTALERSNIRYSLINAEGKKISEGIASNGSVLFNNLISGVYFVVFETEVDRYVQQFIVQ
jgi:hypothetical protein